MKSFIAVTVLLISTGLLSSQTAPSPAQNAATDPYAALLKIKANNDAILKRQETTQKAMEVLLQEAKQLRIFAKRS